MSFQTILAHRLGREVAVQFGVGEDFNMGKVGYVTDQHLELHVYKDGKHTRSLWFRLDTISAVGYDYDPDDENAVPAVSDEYSLHMKMFNQPEQTRYGGYVTEMSPQEAYERLFNKQLTGYITKEEELEMVRLRAQMAGASSVSPIEVSDIKQANGTYAKNSLVSEQLAVRYRQEGKVDQARVMEEFASRFREAEQEIQNGETPQT